MGDIGWARNQMCKGKRVTRPGWNGKGMYLGLHSPEDFNDVVNTLPYVFMITATGARVPWTCSQSDFLAIDWEIHNA